MTRLPWILLALAAWPALAQDASELAPDSAPAPAARPDGPREPVPEGASGETEADTGAAPSAPEEVDPEEAPALIPPAAESADEDAEDVPELVPPDGTEPVEDPAQSEAPADEAVAGPPMREVLAETPEELAACLVELDALGVTHEPAEPVAEADAPDCGMVSPVTVSHLAPGVALEPTSAMRCATALAAARWVSDVVVPMSRKLDRGEVVAIDQGTAYLCRPRADGEMSEHAWGNALDVMGFRFAEGEPLPVEPRAGDGTLEEAFQRAVRAGACLDFTTVLGPGSDEDHADHLHFDIRERDGGFRICE